MMMVRKQLDRSLSKNDEMTFMKNENDILQSSNDIRFVYINFIDHLTAIKTYMGTFYNQKK